MTSKKMYQKESVLHEKRYYFAYKPFFFNSDFSFYFLVTVKPTIQFTVKKKSRLRRQTKLYQDAHPHEKSINFGKLPIT